MYIGSLYIHADIYTGNVMPFIFSHLYAAKNFKAL